MASEFTVATLQMVWSRSSRTSRYLKSIGGPPGDDCMLMNRRKRRIWDISHSVFLFTIMNYNLIRMICVSGLMYGSLPTRSLQCSPSICYLEQKENILGGLANSPCYWTACEPSREHFNGRCQHKLTCQDHKGDKGRGGPRCDMGQGVSGK